MRSTGIVYGICIYIIRIIYLLLLTDYKLIYTLVPIGIRKLIQSIDPQDRNPTSTRGRNPLGRAGRAGSGGLCRGTPAPRRNLCAGDEHKPKESTFKMKTLCGVYIHYRTSLSMTVS